MRARNQAQTVLALSLTALLAGSGCAYLRNSQSMLEEAEAAVEAGDEARAEQLYRELMLTKKGKDSEEGRALLINLLLTRAGKLMLEDKPGDAMAIYRDALSLEPSRQESRIAYARALIKTERFTEAIDVLMEDKACRGCASMISVIYVERGNAGMRDGDYADALADFDLALSKSRDPLIVLAKVDAYTVGKYGTAADAVSYLDHALRLIGPDQVGAQQLWWDKRLAVVYTAAVNEEHGALDEVLALPDPRRRVDENQRVLDRLNLHMYAASLQIYVKAYERGTTRGLAAYAEADGAVPDAELAKLREILLNLFMQRVATHLADDDDAAARAALQQALQIDSGNRTLIFQNVLATAALNTGSARKLLAGFDSDPEITRMRALIEAVYARKMIGIGQLTAARSGVEKAERFAPGLLDARLVRAELEAETRFDGLRKTWAESFREIGTFSYPGGRINNYGRALAELRSIQAEFDDAAATDHLRAPGFAARVEKLEATIKAFYPYDAALAPAEQSTKAIVLFKRTESGEYEAKVQGPRREHLVKVPGEAEMELILDTPGLTIINTPGGRKALFAEPGVKVIVKI